VHSATTKQRHAALKRRLGIFTGAQYWVRKLRERRARAEAARLERAGAGVPGDGRPATASLALATGPNMEATRLAPVPAAEHLDPAPASDRFAPEPAADVERDGEIDTPPRLAPRRAIPLAAWAAIAAALVAAVALVTFARPRPPPGQAGATAAAAGATPSAEPVAVVASAERAAPAGVAQGVGTAVRTITVRSGDTLWHLSGQRLGEPSLWPRIFEMNRDRISNPDLIFPGQQIRVPAG